MNAGFTRVVYLSGGVGGARLLEGMARALPAGALSAIVNVGDDFEHLGLYICPDLDTCMYTLSGDADMERGWGLRDESFRALASVARYGGESWFQLGDRDLGTHLLRTDWLRQGVSLTEITARLTRALGIETRLLPMSDQRLATRIDTEAEGTLAFQDWLVRRRGAPVVTRVRFEGNAQATSAVLGALEEAQLIVIGPSNPYVSVDPILALAGVRERIARVPTLAVSPIVGGRAIKGPLAEMIPALSGRAAGANAIAAHYGELLRGFVVENGDTNGREERPVLATRTVMRTADDRLRLARELLAFAERLC